MNESPWTKEKIATLRLMADDGCSSIRIGKALGFSKDAVVGKAHRLHIELKGRNGIKSIIGSGFRTRPDFDFKAEAKKRRITERALRFEIMNMGLEVYREEFIEKRVAA